MRPAPLSEAADEARYGGKAASLCRALKHGLPVPGGYALETDLVEAIVGGDAHALSTLDSMIDEIGPAVAVRSSAVGEDSKDASFAGQHATVLNVRDQASLLDAVREVHASAHSEAALAYRRTMNIEGKPRIAVAIQTLVPSDVAGVMFTVHPMTGQHERTIEASWGLGEVIVAGAVVPDSFRISEAGEILERIAGEKDLAYLPDEAGGTIETPVEGDRVHALCLDDAQLMELHMLAERCERVHGPALDIEWAFAGVVLHLLQCRAITKAGK